MSSEEEEDDNVQHYLKRGRNTECRPFQRTPGQHSSESRPAHTSEELPGQHSSESRPLQPTQMLPDQNFRYSSSSSSSLAEENVPGQLQSQASTSTSPAPNRQAERTLEAEEEVAEEDQEMNNEEEESRERVFEPPDPDQDSDPEEEVEEEHGDSYFSALEKLLKKWLCAQMTHRVSQEAANSFWRAGIELIPELMALKMRDSITRKTPMFENQRRKLYKDMCPPINLRFAYKHKETGYIEIVDCTSTPTNSYQRNPQYMLLYEEAYIKVSLKYMCVY